MDYLSAQGTSIMTAIDELLSTVMDAYPELRSARVHERALREYYQDVYNRAIIRCVTLGYAALHDRVLCKTSDKSHPRPFMTVDGTLAMTSIVLSPQIDNSDVLIERVKTSISQRIGQLPCWIPDRPLTTDLYNDKTIDDICTAIRRHYTSHRDSMVSYLSTLNIWSHLWNIDIHETVDEFYLSTPSIENIEEKLDFYDNIMEKIGVLDSSIQFGPFQLALQPLKYALLHLSTSWKQEYVTRLHKSASDDLNLLTNFVEQISNDLECSLETIDAVRKVSSVIDLFNESRDERMC